MKTKSIHNALSSKQWLLLVLTSICLLTMPLAVAQSTKKASQNITGSSSGNYRNLFREAGYKQADIDAKLAKAYHDVFEGPNKVYFEVGDTMAYVSDVKNKDARTEGLSYGMMIAVQLDKKDVFDRIWRWSKKYLQHQSGPREAYFAWSINPETMKKNSEGSASDGELYYSTTSPVCCLRLTNGATILVSTITGKPGGYWMRCGRKMEPAISIT